MCSGFPYHLLFGDGGLANHHMQCITVIQPPYWISVSKCNLIRMGFDFASCLNWKKLLYPDLSGLRSRCRGVHQKPSFQFGLIQILKGFEPSRPLCHWDAWIASWQNILFKMVICIAVGCNVMFSVDGTKWEQINREEKRTKKLKCRGGRRVTKANRRDLDHAIPPAFLNERLKFQCSLRQMQKLKLKAQQ